MTEDVSHFPPSHLLFVYDEKMCIQKNVKSFWCMLIHLVFGSKEQFCMLVFLSGTLCFWSYKSKQSSQLEQLSVQITVWTHSYLFWMTLSSTHSSGKTHPYEYQTCYVSSPNM